MAHAPAPATVLICTYNRATLLGETLDFLKATRTARPWDVIVVDNNSTDATRQVVESRIDDYPVPLRYVFEGRQGKSHALNTGLQIASGTCIVFTDDDVRVTPEWLDAGCAALETGEYDYTGGPVRPIWDAPPPPWLDRERSDLWGTLALLDYGPQPFVFEERQKVPLGANMAVTRALVQRIGGFNPELGRRGDSLLGQEQAEFFSRAREARARGLYVPSMLVEHHVPASRLTRSYFRRWWFWKGVSRARLDAMHQLTELGLDLRSVPHLLGVPRFMWGLIPRSGGGWCRARIRGDVFDAMRHEMKACYALGYIRARLARSTSPLATPQAKEAASYSG